MKNEIYFYYRLTPTKTYQQKNSTIFYTNKKKYIFYKLHESKIIIKEQCELYNYLLSKGIYCHKIIPNTNGNIITVISNNLYTLMEVNIKTRKIELEDIKYFMTIKINNNSFRNIKRDNWKKLWKKKVDYIEQQHDYICKIHEINFEDIDFLIGITETCISLLNELNIANESYSLSHNRVSNRTTTDEFYNPFELILDMRPRDLAEYIKNINGLDKKIQILGDIINHNILNKKEKMILFIRLLFPSEYFDLINTELMKNNDSNTKKKKESIINEYYKDTKKIYHYLKGIFNLPNIEWLDNN